MGLSSDPTKAARQLAGLATNNPTLANRLRTAATDTTSPAAPGTSPAEPGTSPALPGASPAEPGSSPALPGTSPAAQLRRHRESVPHAPDLGQPLRHPPLGEQEHTDTLADAPDDTGHPLQASEPRFGFLWAFMQGLSGS
jgi:hypothetical protein